LSVRYKIKNNGNYFTIYFLLLIVGIFAGMVEFIVDITTNASAIGEIPYAICTSSTPGGSAAEMIIVAVPHMTGVCVNKTESK
jgi:hypothetical protein